MRVFAFLFLILGHGHVTSTVYLLQLHMRDEGMRQGTCEEERWWSDLWYTLPVVDFGGWTMGYRLSFVVFMSKAKDGMKCWVQCRYIVCQCLQYVLSS